MPFSVINDSPGSQIKFGYLSLCSAREGKLSSCIEFYQMFLSHSFAGENYNSGMRIDGSKLGADPGLPAEVASGVEGAPRVGNNRSPTYRCKKCRRVVALKEHVVDHVPGEGETTGEWHKWRNDSLFNKCNESDCSSIFIEPLQWMKAGKFTLDYFYTTLLS